MLVRFNSNVVLNRENVQAIVEKPFLHMIGRSTASLEDQRKYTAERIEETISLMNGVKYDGRTYYATARIFTGMGKFSLNTL